MRRVHTRRRRRQHQQQRQQHQQHRRSFSGENGTDHGSPSPARIVRLKVIALTSINLREISILTHILQFHKMYAHTHAIFAGTTQSKRQNVRGNSTNETMRVMPRRVSRGSILCVVRQQHEYDIHMCTYNVFNVCGYYMESVHARLPAADVAPHDMATLQRAYQKRPTANPKKKTNIARCRGDIQ